MRRSRLPERSPESRCCKKINQPRTSAQSIPGGRAAAAAAAEAVATAQTRSMSIHIPALQPIDPHHYTPDPLPSSPASIRSQ